MEREISTFLGPDGLRETLQLLKAFYENHTKNNCGYEAINGCQYVGTSTNFGSELLLEARKLLMDKPPLDGIPYVNDTFRFYFDTQYSDMISTYDQQNLLVAILNRDVCLSNMSYKLKFENCEEVYILRSESWSDPAVIRTKFLKTTTPPTLMLHDLMHPNDPDTTIQLHLSDDTNVETTYYFLKDATTTDVIQSYSNGTLITTEITNEMAQRPFIWMCINGFRLLPNIGFVNNVDSTGEPLLNTGTDGHSNQLLYPYIYGDTNVPTTNVPVENTWFLKVDADDDTSFLETDPLSENYKIAIKQISFVNTSEIGTQPSHTTTVSFDTTYTEMKLSNAVTWLFKKPVVGDYDYNAEGPNRCYAYIALDAFSANQPLLPTQPVVPLVAGFVMTFDEAYLNAYEIVCENAVGGIHIDTSSDYSDNGISKKNGVIHDLGDFDGLPAYFGYMLDRKIHRAHTELYTLRDALNDVNQSVMDKQVSGLILDSAIPQTEMHKVTDNLNVVIKYNATTHRRYDSIGESVSENNILSQITFHSREKFGNSTMQRYQHDDAFIYHGNRKFSIGVMQLDPVLEYARVYVVGNDTDEYENNTTSTNPKPARTIARICDIPTKFTQLTQIQGIAPTLVIDPLYVRTEVNLTTSDKDLIYNQKSTKLLIDQLENSPTKYFPIYPNTTDLNIQFGQSYLTSNGYARTINLNTVLDMTNPPEQTSRYTITTHTPGSGYAAGDTFTFIIGGIYFSGTVDTITPTNGADEISIAANINATINIANLTGRTTVLSTTTTHGSGAGLVVQVIVDETAWAGLQQTTSGIMDGLFAFKMDELDNVWIWTYDIGNGVWIRNCQFTGLPIVYNQYDDPLTKKQRSIDSVFIQNMFGWNSVWPENTWKLPIQSNVSRSLQTTLIPNTENLASDLSSQMLNLDTQDTYYAIYDDPERSATNYSCVRFTAYAPTGNASTDLLPRYHQLNLEHYTNKIGAMTYTRYVNEQPSVCIFNPTKDTVDRYTKVCADAYQLDQTDELTFATIFTDQTGFPSVLDLSTGCLTKNLYVYTEKDPTAFLRTAQQQVDIESRDDLITDLHNASPTIDAYPLRFENTEHAFTKQMLADYMMENSINTPAYKKDNIRLLRLAGEPVVEYRNGKYFGVGEQPTGGYDLLSAELMDPHVSVDETNTLVDRMFVFRVDTDPTIGTLSNYRMQDANGMDISENTLLIYNGNKYIFRNQEWVQIV